ncbi:MAG TPA: tyrosine--tRNA ligase [Candidatus Jorgensenbacteria bacterium]|nr:tyrosine--tRNA ligase [Candidatus Jorgensenbacteria bacterium]
MPETDKQKINEALSRGVDTIYPSREALEQVLRSGKKLRIYHGVDPTGQHLHIGHATNLLTLRRLQRLGHEIIFLIGDFTARIGDPSEKSATRTQLNYKEVKENSKTFKKQASKIIAFSGSNAAKVKFNSTWLKKLSFADVLELASHVTVQQMVKRGMFQKRIEENKDVWLHEFLYPLMQGYDSVAMNVDMEIGGTDQMFNMMLGRTLLKKMKGKEKFVLTTKLLENPKTGKKLMNKSEGGLINLDDEPNDMFGKVMALDDEVMFSVAELSSTMPLADIKKLKKLKPRDAKLAIAREIVTTYHSENATERAENEFIEVFSKNATPHDAPILFVSKEIEIVDLLIKAGISSKSEARRLIKQKAVKINSEARTDINKMLSLKDNDILKVGKHRFFKIKIK